MKTELIQRIKDVHLQFIILMARNLSPPDMEFVDSIFRQDITRIEIADKIVTNIETPGRVNSVSISTKVMHELKLAQPLSKTLMSGVWKLFEKREQRIFNAHKEVNEGKQHFNAYKRSYFLPPEFFDKLELDPANPALLDEYFPPEMYVR